MFVPISSLSIPLGPGFSKQVFMTRVLEGEETMNEHLPRIVIVGGGFGGLAAAKALGRSPAEVVLIDRTNHHVFQPLLYQVATSVLAPGQSSAPTRGILGKQSNTTVIMPQATGVNTERR